MVTLKEAILRCKEPHKSNLLKLLEGDKMKFDQAKILIDAITIEDYEPNDWENKFIEDLLNRKRDLTDKQYACLQKIYDKATGGGVYQNKE